MKSIIYERILKAMKSIIYGYDLFSELLSNGFFHLIVGALDLNLTETLFNRILLTFANNGGSKR